MEGWHGWDAYAPFYDWENVRTVGHRDIPFWRRSGPRTGVRHRPGAVAHGPDRGAGGRSRPFHQHAWPCAATAPAGGTDSARLVRGDIRSLPFASDGHFSLVMAPYGVLQSLLRNQDLRRTLVSVRSVLRPGGTFAMELVPDVPQRSEYEHRGSHCRRRQGGSVRVSLVELVRQDRSR